MNPDMGRVRHVALLAGQQQEHAHGFAIGLRRDRRTGRLPTTVLKADADRGQKSEIAEAPAERDRVVDGTTAGIEHHGGAAELASAGKLFEVPGRIGGDDADRTDPPAAIRLAGDPAELHWQLALFEGNTGPGRRPERRDGASQHDSTSSGSHQQPAAKFERLQKFQTGPFPKSQALAQALRRADSAKPRSDVPMSLT